MPVWWTGGIYIVTGHTLLEFFQITNFENRQIGLFGEDMEDMDQLVHIYFLDTLPYLVCGLLYGPPCRKKSHFWIY